MITFPTKVLEDSKSAICFFSACFEGRNDVQYVRASKIPNVTIVDIDSKKMEIMKTKYPSDWEFIVGDAYDILQKMVANNRTFDVVICDHWLSQSEKVLVEFFDDFFKLANKWFVATFSMEKGLESYTKFINRMPLINLRNAENGNVWLVFKKDNIWDYIT